MTHRERLERKLEKREEWANKREAEGHRRFERACEEAKPFENGQDTENAIQARLLCRRQRSLHLRFDRTPQFAGVVRGSETAQH